MRRDEDAVLLAKSESSSSIKELIDAVDDIDQGHAFDERKLPITRTILVYSVLFLVQVLICGYHILSKVAMKSGANPFAFIQLRIFLSLPVLFVITTVLDGFPKARPRDLPWFAALGLTGILGNQVLFLLGVKYTNPDNSSAVQPLIPVLTTLISLLLGIEKIRIQSFEGVLKVTGITISMGAIALMLIYAAGGTNIFIGNLCLVGNTICFSAFILLQKKPLTRYSSAQTTFFAFLFACVYMLFFNIPFYALSNFQLTTTGWAALCYAAFINSCTVFLLLAWCNRQVSGVVTTSFWAAQPPITTLMSIVFLKEDIALFEGIGGLMLIIGLFCVCWAKYRDQQLYGKPV